MEEKAEDESKKREFLLADESLFILAGGLVPVWEHMT